MPLTDSLDEKKHSELILDFITLTNETLLLLIPKETSSDEDAAQRRWQIALGAMMSDTIHSVLRLLTTNDIRAITILQRCIYEYSVKGRYFAKHPKIALEQFETIPARNHADLARLPFAPAAIQEKLQNDFQEWSTTAQGRNQYSGNKAIEKMVLDLAKPKEIRIGPDDKSYTPGYIISYGIPSWQVHANAPVIDDIFEDYIDPRNWTFNTRGKMLPSSLPVVRTSIGNLAVWLSIIHESFQIDNSSLINLTRRLTALVGDLPAGITAEIRRVMID